MLNLRGVTVPVFGLRARFGHGETEAREEQVVITVTLGARVTGLLADAVSDILTLEPGDVLPVPAMDSTVKQRFLSGRVSRNGRLAALLKLEELFEIDGLPQDLLSKQQVRAHK